MKNLSLPLKIVIAVLVCLLLGSASGILAGSATTEWYMQLQKPSFQPPSWVFGPAWTLLYTLIGLALAFIWDKKASPARSTALKIFAVQFFLNLIWSPIFFYWNQIALALVVIIVLWFLIIATIRAFKKIDTRAAYLLIPYLLWVTFATVLNASIVYLN